jgi:hypothetical protein
MATKVIEQLLIIMNCFSTLLKYVETTLELALKY